VPDNQIAAVVVVDRTEHARSVPWSAPIVRLLQRAAAVLVAP
jgi:hypothetical protein